MTRRTKQLGAVDPERKTSPVAWEADEDTEALRDHGTVVKSGSTLLRCDHGLWLPAGPADDAEP